MNRFVLLAAPEYPPHSIGGGGVVVKNIAWQLAGKGYKVIVMTGYYKTKSLFEKPRVSRDGNIIVLWLPLIPTPKFSPYLESYMPPNLYSLIMLHKILKKILKVGVVHLHGYGHMLIDYVAWLLKRNNKPYVLTIHGIPKSPLYLGKPSLKYTFLIYTRLIGRKTVEGATKITAISRATAKDALLYGARLEQLVIVPNGINPNYADGIGKNTFRKRYGIPPEMKLILCSGRLHPRKGFQYAIAAMQYILKEEPNTVLVIIGDGPYKKILEGLAKKLGVERNIIFTGYVDEITKKEALADADVVLIPSLIEPFGLVALEAMIMGKPIVAGNVDGLREILSPYEFLVNPKNIHELACKTLYLLRNSGIREEVKRHLLEKVHKYHWDSIVSIYENIYRTLISLK